MASPVDTATPRVSTVLNKDRDYDPANPHTHLVLVGDASDAPYPRVMFGTLRPEFRGHANSAVAFALAKVMVSASPGTAPWTQTVAWAEVLLPPAACDRFGDPRVLMQAVDDERPERVNALLSYLTFTYPTERLHAMREEVRQFVRTEIVERYQVAAFLTLHDPGRAGSSNTTHIHALVVPRRLTAIGFAEQVGALTTDKAHAALRDAFLAHWTARR